MLNKKITNIKARNSKEKRFKAYGQLAIFFVLTFLAVYFLYYVFSIRNCKKNNINGATIVER